MLRQPVESRAIASVGYDEPGRVLEIEYRTGKIYRYREVPPGVFEWLMKTPNKGAYVSRMIAESYAFERDGPPEPEDAELERALRDSCRDPE